MGFMVSLGLIIDGLKKVGMHEALMISIFSINNEGSGQIKGLGLDLAVGDFFMGFHKISQGFIWQLWRTF